MLKAVYLLFLLGSLLTQLPRAQAQTRQIFLIQSVVWEGENMAAHNLNALRKLKTSYPDEPFIHFVSPSYFNRSATEASRMKAILKELITPKDGIALNITAWRSEVHAAELIFRDAPSFFGNVLTEIRCQWDCGREISITTYPPSELRQLIFHSQKTLRDHGFPTEAFHIQGWVSSQDLFLAARENGLSLSYSAVSADILRPRLHQYPIFHWILSSWGSRNALEQPSITMTKAGPILEVGNYLASMDYLSAEHVLTQFQALHQADIENAVFHISLRAESSFERINHYMEAKALIEKYSQDNNLQLIPYVIKADQDVKAHWPSLYRTFAKDL